MSCALAEKPPQQDQDDVEDEISWPMIVAMVRRRAAALPPPEAEQLSMFADVIQGFAEMNGHSPG